MHANDRNKTFENEANWQSNVVIYVLALSVTCVNSAGQFYCQFVYVGQLKC